MALMGAMLAMARVYWLRWRTQHAETRNPDKLASARKSDSSRVFHSRFCTVPATKSAREQKTSTHSPIHPASSLHPANKRELPSKAELDGRLIRWAAEGMSVPPGRTVVDLFRAQARLRPKALAVKDGPREMNYRTLDRLSNRVANCLLRAGLRREEVVAFSLDRSCAYVVAVLGILKAGGAYMPLDAHTPAEALAFQLRDSEARFALTTAAGQARFKNWEGTVFTLDDNGECAGEQSDSDPMVSCDPRARAYLIYTSGSTGRPKGVEIEHLSMLNMTSCFHQWFDITCEDRTTLIANVAFDVSVTDLWPCLCMGAAALVPPRGLMTDLDGLIQWLAAERITYSFVPTALVEIMLTRPWPKQMALRYLITAGDALHARPPRGLPFHVINGYGPTENTVLSTCAVVAPMDPPESPTIGRPTGNVTVYVLDETGKPVKPGTEGELYIGGVQVARGYLNRPELNRERFLPDPFSNEPGARMYRTGDWVRLRQDGELDFLGRRDDQVQIRGRRVELGEVEQKLHIHPEVKQACCRPIYDGKSVTGIAAHVACINPNKPGLADELRKHLSTRVQPYMVPTEFAFYTTLPLTSRGKVNRAALQTPRKPTPTHMEKVLPGDTLEGSLAQLWYSLFPLAREAGVDATFDSLGGDSLHAIKLQLGVEELTGQRIAFSTFMLDPTLPGLCRTVKATKSEGSPTVLVLRREGKRLPLFCLYGAGGDSAHYVKLSKVIGDDQPMYAVRSPTIRNPQELPPSIEEAARQAAAAIREVYPRGPVGLLGYSWGGLLAFEIARQWSQTGQPPPFIGLVGTPAPRRHVTRGARLAHFARRFPTWTSLLVWDSLRGHRSLPGPARIAKRLKQYVVRDPAEQALPLPSWASNPVQIHHLSLSQKYQPTTVIPLDLHLFRERESFERLERPFRPECYPFIMADTDLEKNGGWERWAGKPVQVHWLETNHDEVIKTEGVTTLAEQLRGAMDAWLKS